MQNGASPSNGARPARPTYTDAEVWRMLRSYQSYLTGTRPPKREGELAARRQQQDEASFVGAAIRKADLERGLRMLPWETSQIIFAIVAEGRAPWRVGEFWGLAPAGVQLAAKAGVEKLTAVLNGERPVKAGR